jgi:hypothetical protein
VDVGVARRVMVDMGSWASAPSVERRRRQIRRRPLGTFMGDLL